VLVTLGGGDPDNATLRVMSALMRISTPRLNISIVVGAANPNGEILERALPALQAVHDARLIKKGGDMPTLMREADIAVSAAGSSCWELAFLGVPMAVVVIADNQKDIAAEIGRFGAGVTLGSLDQCILEVWAGQIQSVIESPSIRASMSRMGESLVDGRGAGRVAAFLSGRYSITIATAESGWLKPLLVGFVRDLREAGHEVMIVTREEEMKGGDFLFLLSYWGIVSDTTRERYLHALVVHESDLPKGRGWSPATWLILAGQNCIPVCLIEAGSQVDCGDVYIRDTIELEGHELVDEWRHRLAEKTLELCWRFLAGYPDAVSRREIQCGEGTYLARRKPEDSRLSLAHSLESQFNLLRVVDNTSYPAFFEYKGHRYLLKVEKVLS
jgi:hypothetical protein